MPATTDAAVGTMVQEVLASLQELIDRRRPTMRNPLGSHRRSPCRMDTPYIIIYLYCTHFLVYSPVSGEPTWTNEENLDK
jgi:hypothetical protein